MLTLASFDLMYFSYSQGAPTDPVHIKSIEVSPDPPKPGANMTVKVIGQADEQVEVTSIVAIYDALLTVKVGRCIRRCGRQSWKDSNPSPRI